MRWVEVESLMGCLRGKVPDCYAPVRVDELCDGSEVWGNSCMGGGGVVKIEGM